MGAAIGSLALGFCSGIGGATTQVFGFASAVAGIAYTGLIFVGEFIIELGGYGVASFGCLFTCFTGVFVRMSTELLRPVTEWEGSEAKKLARGGCVGVCCTCCAVVTCLFTVTLVLAYTATLVWYELDDEIEMVTGSAVGN